MESKLATTSSHHYLTGVVCWTRMQAEAGQDLETIIARKEVERRVGGGLFFWGIGNAPNRSVKNLAAKGDEIDVVFSLMKTRPKIRDVAPDGVLVWQTYFDIEGAEHELPPHVLVTSRMGTASGMKRVHYALMCSSDGKLQLDDQGPFDPLAYRNVSDTGGPVAPSQVTALVVRSTAESPESDYRINLRARLAGSYWVRLGKARVFRTHGRGSKMAAIASYGDTSNAEWTKIVADIREPASSTVKSQSTLF